MPPQSQFFRQARQQDMVGPKDRKEIEDIRTEILFRCENVYFDSDNLGNAWFLNLGDTQPT
jgi:hypothetical protein